jgi:hypothetical protein
MASATDLEKMKGLIFETAKLVKKFEKNMKWQCSCGLTLDNSMNYCSECGLGKGESAQPIAPAPKAKGRPRKNPENAVAPKAKGRPKKEVVKQEQEPKIKREQEDSDGVPAAKHFKSAPDPMEVVCGYVKGKRTMNRAGECVRCASGGSDRSPHDYSCPHSRLFCPFGRMPRHPPGTVDVYDAHFFAECIPSFDWMPGRGSYTAPGTPLSLDDLK